jgi:hypothetical protein
MIVAPDNAAEYLTYCLSDYCLKAELLPLTGQFIDVYNIIVIQSGYVLKIVVMINCLLILCYAFVNVVGTDILQNVYRRRKLLIGNRRNIAIMKKFLYCINICY